MSKHNCTRSPNTHGVHKPSVEIPNQGARNIINCIFIAMTLVRVSVVTTKLGFMVFEVDYQSSRISIVSLLLKLR